MLENATDLLKSKAIELGFEMVGVAKAKQPENLDAYFRWIETGMHAGMNYLAERKDARKHPDSVLPGVRSLLMLGVSYQRVLKSFENHPVQELSGIAEYARGEDYHHWIRRRLKKLGELHRKIFPEEQCRGAVDTAPILERQFAVEAGLGWIGKNTMLINERFGSKFFLASLLSTVELDFSKSEPEKSRCGDCRRCRDVCPTRAIVEDYVLDARRCLNYWSIEYFGSFDDIPHEIRERLNHRFYGCDCCQDVCPWNAKQKKIPEGIIDPKILEPDVLQSIANGTPLERKFGRKH